MPGIDDGLIREKTATSTSATTIGNELTPIHKISSAPGKREVELEHSAQDCLLCVQEEDTNNCSQQLGNEKSALFFSGKSGGDVDPNPPKTSNKFSKPEVVPALQRHCEDTNPSQPETRLSEDLLSGGGRAEEADEHDSQHSQSSKQGAVYNEAERQQQQQCSEDLGDAADLESLGSADANYLNEEEEEALQLMLSQQEQSPTHLELYDDLSSLTEPNTLTMIQHSQQLQFLRLNRVMLSVGPQREPAELEDVPEEDDDDVLFGVPELACEESSHTSAVMVLEQLEEALAANSSVTHVALMTCHPKVVESVLWGISCVPSNLYHLAVDMWNFADRQRTKYLIWEGLAEVLKHSTTLELLFMGNAQEGASAVNWHLLTQGISLNTSLVSFSIETSSWNDQATTLMAAALFKHPQLCNSEFVYEQRDGDNNDDSGSPLLVTIRQKEASAPPQEVAVAPAQQAAFDTQNAVAASQPLEDFTNNATPKRAKLIKAVSEDTSGMAEEERFPLCFEEF